MFKMIYNIAKTELQMLFYSPVAWLILVIFMVQASLTFTTQLDGLVKSQEMGYSIQGSTLAVFSGWRGVFSVMQSYLYFYIPLLTMGLVSRELSSGSIRLLYSSPITNFMIIVGKFFSMMIYGAIMMGLLFLLVVFSGSVIKDFDYPAILTGLLGLYLLTCAYAAIGIFMSSLTSYQIVAAIGTFAILMGLNMVGGWWQDYDFIRDVTYWLSINGRCEEFVRGMICSEDLLYFLIVICLFLALTIIRLNAVRQKIRFVITLGRNLGVIFLACGLGYFSSLPKLMWFYDSTETKTLTLTHKSQDIVSKLDGGVTITTYINILDQDAWYATPQFMKPDMDRFKQYRRFKPDMKLKYEYYYDKAVNPRLDQMYPDLNDRQRMVKVAEMYNLDSNKFQTPEEIRAKIDLSGEGNSFVRQIVRDNGEKAWLRVYSDMQRFPSEREITAAFKRMVMELPKVGFLQGQGERSMKDNKDRSYSLFANEKSFRYALMNQGFDVEEVNLKGEISGDIKILVIPEMREFLTPEEDVYLQQYIDRGGDLFILGEPKRKDVMNPLFAKFGFELLPGVLVKQDSNFLADMIRSYPMEAANEIAYDFGTMRRREYVATTPSVAGLAQIVDKGYVVTELFKTDSTCWNELETVDYVDDTVRLNPEIGEIQKSYSTVVALSRNVGDKVQKIILSGDADVISNSELGGRRGVRASNFSLITGGFFWMSDSEAPIDVRRPNLPDDKITIGATGVSVSKGLFTYFVPLLLMGLGILIWIRRRGR